MPSMATQIEKLPQNKFPKLLQEIPDPPKELYLRGTLPKESMTYLSVVGSRRYTDYGKKVCEELIAKLSGYNIVIVSGLALGIDSIAHNVALQAGLPTIAIPGSGLHDTVLYPSTHRPLAHKIGQEGGALLSELAPETKAAPYTFPKRNRIIAGISHGVLIIEAGLRSGTLITARLALEYNREVLTVPGSIYSTNTKGPHYLIKNGATPVSDVSDILEVFGIVKKTHEVSPSTLTETEQMIFNTLTEPQERDLLFEKIKLSPHELNMTLSAMEIKGIIEERLGKVYRL